MLLEIESLSSVKAVNSLNPASSLTVAPTVLSFKWSFFNTWLTVLLGDQYPYLETDTNMEKDQKNNVLDHTSSYYQSHWKTGRL